MLQKGFDDFRNLVLQDPVLQDEMKEITDFGLFTELIVKLGHERGYNFAALEVEVAVNASRRAWFERWITR